MAACIQHGIVTTEDSAILLVFDVTKCTMESFLFSSQDDPPLWSESKDTAGNCRRNLFTGTVNPALSTRSIII